MATAQKMVSADELRETHRRVRDLRTAYLALRRAKAKHLADQVHDAIFKISRLRVVVEVPCSLCRGIGAHEVTIGDETVPTTGICVDCDRRASDG